MDTKETKYLNLLSKVLNNEATSEEEKKLKLWSEENSENKAFVDTNINNWKLSGNYAKDIPVDTDIAWNNFENKLSKVIKKESRSGSIKFLKKLQIAAAFTLISLSLLWLYNFNFRSEDITKFITSVEENKEVELPDGSHVLMNENSVLSFNRNFNPRSVTLQGEAFFEVAEQDGDQFEILTEKTKTTVLGTSFNVRAYAAENSVEVAVLSGKVAFEAIGNTQKTCLMPNEKAVYNAESDKLEATEKSDLNSIAWKTGQLIFENNTVSEVTESLEHFFDINISTENSKVLNCHYTGKFEEPDLNEILDALAFSTNLQIKKVDNKYILIGQGCE